MMNANSNPPDFLMILLAAAIPAIVVGGTVLLLMKRFFESEQRKRIFELKYQNAKSTLPLRLQAYERLTLLMERISFNNLIVRVKSPGMNATELHAVMVSEIRNEFEHNLSQQIYIGHDTWIHIQNAKEESIRILNMCYAQVGMEASALDLSKKIIETTMNDENGIPTFKAILLIKKEAAEILI